MTGGYTPPSAGASFANPTGSVGTSTVNGSLTTAMRSDAAPALNPVVWNTPGAIGSTIPNSGVFTSLLATSGLIQRNGTTGQVLEIDRSYTDASNHSEFKLSLTGTTAAFTLTGAGTGASTLTGYTFDKTITTTAGVVTPVWFDSTTAFQMRTTSTGILQFGGTSSSFIGLGRDIVNSFTIQAAAGAATYNDPSTAASGTIANRYILGIAAPTLTATNTGITDTVASTLYIGGAPTAGTNTTIGTAYSLNVASGVSNFGGRVQSATTLKSGSFTVATLPSASTEGAGARAFVTDALASTFGTTVTAGGSNKLPVISDATNWIIG